MMRPLIFQQMNEIQLPAGLPVRPAHVINLGTVEYENALEFQRSLRDRRIAGTVPDTLVLLEHPPIITIGRSGDTSNVLASESHLSRLSIRLLNTNRGGDVTYHGPGQIVGYTIMDLRPYGMNLRAHLRRLEEVVIRALEPFGIAAGRNPDYTGVWVGSEKIASIGLHVRRWVTMHGFALNLDSNLDHFSLIHPCGIPGRPMTSITRLLNRPVDPAGVRAELARTFAEVFRLNIAEQPIPKLTPAQISVTGAV